MQTSVIGFPRIGTLRELKFASEKYFRKEIEAEELQQIAETLRKTHWSIQKEAGIDYISSNDFSFYDMTLDTAVLLNIIPKRYKELELSGLDTYFAMARGYQGASGDVKALAMKKWFNTNYHYIVPEVEDDTVIQLSGNKLVDEYAEAKALGIETKPVVIGAYTMLRLCRFTGKKPALDYVEDIISAYQNLVKKCEENQIVLSNTKHGSTGSDFEELDDKIKKGYHQTVNLYGTELEVYVRRTGENAIANIAHNLPSILLLILINAILPFFFVHILNHSFTKRITELNEVFKSVDSEQLVPMRHEGGKDEIGSMIRSYNRMAARTNELIQTVYKNKLVEQEMLVSRKNAELLALHSQINPHFLFNALESIRMHSILKNENETADMVEKLAVMQRQYVEWGEDSVTIEQEVEFVKAYLALQKYRFGERLSYQIEIDEECRKRKVPKLTLVTFVENACVHGIESKASPGWIFVRVYEQNELICMEIEDTGNGMEEGKRQELLENMRNADIEMLKKKGRVGIVNACLRLKMVSENKVKIDLDGEEGVGTLITIWMPLEYM